MGFQNLNRTQNALLQLIFIQIIKRNNSGNLFDFLIIQNPDILSVQYFSEIVKMKVVYYF